MSNLFSPSVVRDLYGSGYAFKNISGMCYKSKHPECEISFENIVTSIVIGLFVILSLIVFSMIFGICLIICINLGTPEYD